MASFEGRQLVARRAIVVMLLLVAVVALTACWGAWSDSLGSPDNAELSNGTRAAERRQDKAAGTVGSKYLTLDLGGGVMMKLALIRGGSFLMGSPSGESKRDEDEALPHRVTISKPFYMGIHEVTQEQYQAVMGTNPSRFNGASNPVEQVSWKDATEFCDKLSNSTGKTVRLPTEAEWEYACRAGSHTRFCCGDSDSGLGQYAWHAGNSGKQTHPAGQKKPNTFGLHDMHGNVWEWCEDWYGEDARRNARDSRGPGSGSNPVVLRGGSYSSYPRYCRSACRLKYGYVVRCVPVGFRVVVSAGRVN